jgi:diguanylate cyclase (GGDEF)-like protein
MPRLLRAAVLCLSLAWLVAASAQSLAPAVPVDATLARTELTPRIELLEDPGGKMDLHAVQVATGFRPVPAEGIKIGFSKSAWWARVTLANTGNRDRAMVLRENYPLMDYVTLWSPQPDGSWRQVRTGDRRDFYTREYDHRDFLFNLTLPASTQQTYYLRFASSGPIDIALELYEPHALLGDLNREQLAFGAYFGGFLVLVLYNFFIFLVVRDRAFFYYLVYAISYGLYFFVYNGLSFQLLWPHAPEWGNTSLLVLLCTTLVFGLQFTRTLLGAGANMPRLDKLAIALQGLSVAGLVAAFFLSYAQLIQPVALLTLLVTVTIIAIGTIGLLSGSRPARYFMIAWGLLLAGVLMNMLKTFGVLPHNLITANGLQIGSLCEMVLLSLALGARVNEIQRQSRTDALTKLFNRRFFDERVAFEFERAQRYHTPIALLVADIDHFKSINDKFGHARGDDILRLVAKQLLEGVRSQDIVCRYGGEEFALILPGTDGAQAAAVAEALRVAIEHGKTGLPMPVTVSVGVASPQDGAINSVGDLFHHADAALYEAKASGRNRVVRWNSGASVLAREEEKIEP